MSNEITYFTRIRVISLSTFISVINWTEGCVLFNDALNTFYLRLYDVGHMVNDH